MEAIVQSKSLVEQTYDAILEAIGSGELLPGDRLNQDDIAMRLGVSRQPVNSAISILKVNGLVQDTGRRGTVVSELTPAAIQNVYEFRLALEPFAVARATERQPPTASTEAADILSRGELALSQKDVVALVTADADFHQTIYRWSGNSVIEDSMQMNWHFIRRAMAGVLKSTHLARKSWNEHAEILEAVLDRDADRAAILMQKHIEDARQLTVDLAADAKDVD